MRSPSALSLVLGLLAVACADPTTGGLDRKALRATDKVERDLRDYLGRTVAALERHAGSLAGALEEPEGDPRRRAAYPLVQKLRNPAAGRGQSDFDLTTAGLIFTAVLDGEGKFVVRDEGPEKMYREDLRGRFDSVRQALAGQRACSSGLLPGNDYAVVVVAVPIRRSPGPVLGAFIGAVSYPALARRIERQRSYEANASKGGLAKAPTIRVALYYRDQYHAGSIQPELDPFRPKIAARRARLAKGKGRYAEGIFVQARPFGMAVRDLPALGQDAGLILWRAEAVR